MVSGVRCAISERHVPGLLSPVLDLIDDVRGHRGHGVKAAGLERLRVFFQFQIGFCAGDFVSAAIILQELPPLDHAPDAGQAFRPAVAVMPTPWNPNTRLVNIAIQGAVPQVEHRPPLNLVFLVDTSGSMKDANKLPLLKQSLALLLAQLRPEDQVALVAYAGAAGEVLPPTSAAEHAKILAALDQLAAGGSTAGAQGLELAYQVAGSMAASGEVSRVLLATDGDFNVGIDDPQALKDFIAKKRDSGVYLSVLGFGRGNLDDATMQALAQNGNGTASYIDTLNEARKVLVDEAGSTLFTIAKDLTKMQIEVSVDEADISRINDA